MAQTVTMPRAALDNKSRPQAERRLEARRLVGSTRPHVSVPGPRRLSSFWAVSAARAIPAAQESCLCPPDVLAVACWRGLRRLRSGQRPQGHGAQPSPRLTACTSTVVRCTPSWFYTGPCASVGTTPCGPGASSRSRVAHAPRHPSLCRRALFPRIEREMTATRLYQTRHTAGSAPRVG